MVVNLSTQQDNSDKRLIKIDWLQSAVSALKKEGIGYISKIFIT